MDSSHRLVLWDVDGTLLTAGPVARSVFDEAFVEVFGRHPGDHRVSMGGKTDPLIATEIMAAAGVPGDEAQQRLPDLLAALAGRLEQAAHRLPEGGRVHPGIRELLARLHEHSGVIQSVLTGNVAPNARLKVAAFGLHPFLDLEVGAYGSDHHDRERLVPVALRRVEWKYGWTLDPEAVWVVGDTARDLACARAAGARCLLVATGRAPLEELAGLGADAALPDLADGARVLDLLLG